MSSSIIIPTGPNPTSEFVRPNKGTEAQSSSSASSYSSSPLASSASPTSTSGSPSTRTHARRHSLLSDAISKQECTVINIGDPDGPPRLISYLSSSQGFAWNPEIFLPSYIDCEYVPLEHRREPVHEILLTEEEAKSMLPQ